MTETYKPHIRVHGKNNRNELKPAVMGNAKATTADLSRMSGDLLNTYSNDIYGESLLLIVQTGRRINRLRILLRNCRVINFVCVIFSSLLARRTFVIESQKKNCHCERSEQLLTMNLSLQIELK